MVFDSDSETDAHARARLRSDPIGWLTTVTEAGQPQTFPIWFLWEEAPDGGGGEVLIYGDRRAKRNANVAINPRVSFHLNDDGGGGDVVVIEGVVTIDDATPALSANAAYVAKYRDRIARAFNTPEEMATIYGVPLRIRPTRGIAFGA
jgi:PPOX class probable F420-dependent enzyme